MEVVVRNGQRWLVSYFRFDSHRLFLGVIDWDEGSPQIRQISRAGELAEFPIFPR